MSEMMDPAKLKVVELRAELSSRGLDTRGNKAALVDRLKDALELETGESIPNSSILETSTEDGPGDTSVSSEKEMDVTSGNGSNKNNPGAPQEMSQVQVKEESKESNRPQQQRYEPDVKQEAGTPVKMEKSISQGGGQLGKMEVKEESERSEIKAEKDTASAKEDTNRNDRKQESGRHETKDESRDHRERESDRRGEKRRRSPSPSPRGRSPPRRADDEPDYDENAVLLSWYDSDLNLVIDKDKFQFATPMYQQGFGYIWAGARASHGFTSGKVCFEVKLLENCDVSHLEDEPTPHVLRVGWSTILTSMQLGEEPQSYGYGGTGKASTDCKFKNYGRPFVDGDVVGAFLDMNSDPIIMSYSVNGESQGVAYEISRSSLEGNALYPHILTKNIKFQCNFGGQESWFPLLPGYKFVGDVPIDARVPGPRRPTKRSDCEMIMMCGLPACGKTTWANEWYMKNLHKNYNILGSNNLIDKMKVMGLPRKRNYAGRWDVLIDRCMKCLAKLLEIAARRRRNYILDQTNVYPSAQRRKMRGFEGFVRRAVVIVPTDEEFKKRIEKQEKIEGKDVPDSAVLEMKANFTLPEKGDIFSEVMFTELGEEECRALVQKYNAEGRDAGYGVQHKRPRFDNRDRDRDRDRDRSSYRGGFRPRGGPPDRNRSGGGGWQPRGGSGGPGGGGWRDRQPPPFRSGSGGSSGGGGGGGGWRGSRGGGGGSGNGGRGHDSHGSRGFDRNRPSGGSSNRNQSSGGKGNWGGSYNQSGTNWESGGSNQGSTGSWGQQQNYSQQGWGQQGGSQQGWKGNYNQQSGGSGGGYNQGGYNQQGYGSGQQGYGNSGTSQQNWSQPYNQYGTSGNQGWGQGNADNSYSGNYPQQQGAWQGYGGQGYSYSGSNQQMQQGNSGYTK